MEVVKPILTSTGDEKRQTLASISVPHVSRAKAEYPRKEDASMEQNIAHIYNERRRKFSHPKGRERSSKEGRNVRVTVDIPSAFMQTDLDDVLIISSLFHQVPGTCS